MTMEYRNLTERTRAFIAQEVEQDFSRGRLYYSKRFNDKGRQEYPTLLLEAVKYHDDNWLASELSIRGCFIPAEVRHTQRGNAFIARTPYTAEETLAEGEFNRFYMRGVCLVALQDGIPEVIVYRGKTVEQPRQESEAMIGLRLPVSTLLDDLRCSPGSKTQHGLPAGPNSGITICLP